MKFIYRLGYFSIGLIMGIIILMFFLGGKKTSCDYSPNARTLKNIRIKERSFSAEAIHFFEVNKIDTSSVSAILEDGNVDFLKSKTKQEPCKIYFISGEMETGTLELQIENCKKTATVQRVEILEK
jgi:hypothetical protein